jgi:hypothetical protein
MSTDQHLSNHSAPPTASGTPPAGLGASPARTRIVAVALALGAVAVAAMLVWRPWGETNSTGYGDIAPIRDNLWVGILIDSTAFAVVAIAVALATCLLVQHRGSRWANTGAVLTVLGGVLFAMGQFAHAVLGWFATSTAISTEAGKALISYADDNPVRVMVPGVAGFLMVSVGMLLLAIAQLRSHALPRWMPISLIVLTVAQFGPIPNRLLDFVQVAVMGVLVCLAGVLVDRSRA